MDLTLPLAECLDAIYRLEREGPAPAPSKVARRLGLDGSTSSERILALAGLGLVRRDDAGRVLVTPDGRRLAVALLRKHRLLERFLSDMLKLPWERVHVDATRMTPVLSDEAAERLDVLLGQPTHCPHGNPIPSAGGDLEVAVGTPLHRVRAGHAAVIIRIEREDPEVLKYLAALGLLPETRIRVEEIAPLGGPVLVSVGSSRYALGRKVAAHIIVREA